MEQYKLSPFYSENEQPLHTRNHLRLLLQYKDSKLFRKIHTPKGDRAENGGEATASSSEKGAFIGKKVATILFPDRTTPHADHSRERTAPPRAPQSNGNPPKQRKKGASRLLSPRQKAKYGIKFNFFNFFRTNSCTVRKIISIFALAIGEMPEWSIGPHSKCGERATVPGVRIPLSPRRQNELPGLR